MKMRRLTTYVAGSTVLATAVMVYAALQRPNFYSAAVYLSQSNACLMILCNMALVISGSFMYGLQQLLFGPLRPLETEQLWERGWFAMMEWIFAMSTFRDEFGVWFLVMFTSLFAGKVWGWIAEGRVEQLEQQAPNDPRLFHGRLITSLLIYVAFATQLFLYNFDTVIMQARPGMTIMFVFEFAILCISAITTCLRYGIWIQEHRIIRKQITQAMVARKAEIRKIRTEAEEKLKANPEAEDAPNMADLPKEEDVDENEIEAPGWESKRSWLFALDIVSDLLKMAAYMAFFTVLTIFYGLPIYIIRDLYMTMRSFTKRLSDYYRFQAATRDMDTRYPSATADDLAADNTCIVCREEMRPADAPPPDVAFGQALHQRQKPKKLPCGHVLHFGCLSSWLERQQACPTCRRSVFATGPAPRAGQTAPPAGQPANQANPAQPGQPHAPHGGNNPPQPPQPRARPRGGFQFRLGNFNFQIGRGVARPDDQQVLNILGQLARINRDRLANRDVNNTGGAATQGSSASAQASGAAPGALTELTSVVDPANSDIHPGVRSAAARMALNTIEQQIQREIQALSAENRRAGMLRNLLNELDRARGIPLPPPQLLSTTSAAPPYAQSSSLNHHQSLYQLGPGADTVSATPPPGVTVPQGWNLIPIDPVANSQPSPAAIQNMLSTFLANQGPASPQALAVSVTNPLLPDGLPAPLIPAAVGDVVPDVNSRPVPHENGVVTSDGHSSEVGNAAASSGSSPTSPHVPITAPTASWSFPPAASETGNVSSEEAREDKGKARAVSDPNEGSTLPRSSSDGQVRQPSDGQESSGVLQPTVEDVGDED